jgi:toxin YoeB
MKSEANRQHLLEAIKEVRDGVPGHTITFMDNATDKKIIKKIRALLKDIKRTPYKGLGKPEPLKHNLSGYWSRHITEEHRLVYKIENDAIRFQF